MRATIYMAKQLRNLKMYDFLVSRLANISAAKRPSLAFLGNVDDGCELQNSKFNLKKSTLTVMMCRLLTPSATLFVLPLYSN